MNQDEIYQQMQAENMKKQILFKHMTKEARERLNFVKQAHPQLAEQMEMAILQTLQMGHNLTIDENQIREIFNKLYSKKEFSIRRV